MIINENSSFKLVDGFFLRYDASLNLDLSEGMGEIYIRADGVMGIYDKNKIQIAIKAVKKTEVIDVSEYCNMEECYILILAFQFDIPYFYTNTTSGVGKNIISKGFFEYYWEKRGKTEFDLQIPKKLLEFQQNMRLEQAKNSLETCIINHGLYVTGDFISRIIHKGEDGVYMSHYLPNMTNPLKTSLLEEQPLKQHQRFVFFARMNNACQIELAKDTKMKKYDLGYYDHLYGCAYLIDTLSGEKWTADQLKKHRKAVFSQMPDCEFFYENDRWFGLEKCHTTTATYLVKNGAVICTYHDVSPW